jgi:hypothetical protein
LALCATTAHASDTSFPRRTSGKLAIKRVSDSQDDAYVTYRVETYDGYDNVKDFYEMKLSFDLNGDGRTEDMCVHLEQVGDGRLRAVFYPKCGPAVWSTAEGKKLASNIVEFRLRIWDLVNGGGVVPGKPFSYSLWAQDMQGNQETVPAQGLIQETAIPASWHGAALVGGSSVNNELAAAGNGGGASTDAGAGATHVDKTANARKASSPAGWIAIGVILGALLAGAVFLVMQRRRLVWVDARQVREADSGYTPSWTPHDNGSPRPEGAPQPEETSRSFSAPAQGAPVWTPQSEGWPIDDDSPNVGRAPVEPNGKSAPEAEGNAGPPPVHTRDT